MEPSFSGGNKSDERQALAEGLRDFYSRTHRMMDRLMKAQGASFSQTRLLLFIAHEGPVRSTDISHGFSLAPRTITEAVDALERDGLVRRDPDPQDRRAKRISITEVGREAIRKAEPSGRRFLDEVFGVLDAGETASLVALMRKLNDRLKSLE